MDYRIAPITPDVAKRMIVKNHYSHCWTMCDVSLGIFEKSNNQWFGDDELIGCIVYGTPVGRQVCVSISPLINQNEVLELTRLWIKDGTPKNTESFCISKSFEWLRKNRPDIKILISYADPMAGHLGRIYQATNWIYQHIDRGTTPRISFTGPPHYEWLHPRTVVSMYGTRNLKELQSIVKSSYWMKMDTTKYRYLYILTKDRRKRKELFKSLIHPHSAYPKSIEYEEKVIKVDANMEGVEFLTLDDA